MVFRDHHRGGFIALDPYENRQISGFVNASEAQAQVTQWRQQAIVNFIAGAASEMSLVVGASGADGLVGDTGTEMYAVGQRAGIGASVASGITGVGFVNAVIGRFGRGSISIMKEMAVFQSLSRASVDDKLARYLLNPAHPGGGAAKAQWFKEALGFTQENAGDLAKQIVFDPRTAVQTAKTEHGILFNQIISIAGANGKMIDVKFAWIRNNDGIERLVTAIPTRR